MSVFKQLHEPAPSLLRQFWALVKSPVQGIRYVLDASPDLGGLAIALALIGFLRGITEGYWFYLMKGTQAQLPYLLTQELWYVKYGGPFLSIVSTPGR